MRKQTKDLLHLHLIVFIYGFTAILGRLISLDAIELVWYRMLIAFLSLGIILFFSQQSIRLSKGALLKMLLVGFVVAIHWITFFHAIKISTISVALGCLASTTLFTSILEPIIVKRTISFLEIIIGLLIIIGLYTIFQFETHYLAGIITGVSSAFFASLFTVLNKRLIAHHHPVVISFYEMSGGLIAITLYLWLNGILNEGLVIPNAWDWLYLILLGVVCTAYAYMASVRVMQSLSAYTVVLTINLEPIYGIIMAFLLFGETERMSGGFYIGALIILGSVLLFPIIRQIRINQQKANMLNS
ncbi:DMT family transporter [Geofilum sp. OHC36d9]|uniref:DMT family transporter n=1 Tax=Geofilum sp. OHC36d9 TaxID=3458413 RepID=UPI00403468A2